MIAPIRETEPPVEEGTHASREVRRLVASLFLDEDREVDPAPSPVSHWKAWLLVGWAAAITLVYLASMLNLT